MLNQIKARLVRLEQRIWTRLPLWPDDSDGFLAALSDLAAEDWKE